MTNLLVLGAGQCALVTLARLVEAPEPTQHVGTSQVVRRFSPGTTIEQPAE